MAYKNEEQARKKRINLYFSLAELKKITALADIYGEQKASLMREKLLDVAEQEVQWVQQFGQEKAAKMRERLAKLAQEEVERAELCARLAGLAKKEAAGEIDTARTGPNPKKEFA